MKTAILRTAATFSLSLALVSVSVAATVNPADTPITNTVDPDVKPTIMFILDDSGSMGWEYMPDTVNNNNSKHCYRNSYYNRVYFEPSRSYARPVDSTGALWAYAPSFTSARKDGFNTGSSVVNISTKFRAGNDSSDQEAYYYQYTGTTPATPVAGTCYPDTSYTLVKIKNLTLADQQNFANWYSFYRTRILMMKSAMTLAFKGVDDQFRIGYMSINNNTGSDFLNPVVFDAAGKLAWYNKVLAAQASNGTGLRWALSTAGQLFGNKLTGKKWFSSGITITDPVKYSCQQNLTIMSTDGFWNSQTTGIGCSYNEGCYLDGSKMGNTDSGLPPPYKDANATPGTLADIAYYYFNTDLRSDLTDNVFPMPDFNDTNKFQHMNTFTIGLGVSGTLAYAYPYVGCSGCDYPGLAANPQTKTWPVPVADTLTAVDDLWHAAVNGHGLYFGAQTPDDVIDGLNKIVAGFPRPGAGGAAAVGNQVSTVGDGLYLAGFKTVDWTGDLQKYAIIDADNATVSTTASWSAQAKLDTRVAGGDDRKIYFAKDGALVDFNASNLGGVGGAISKKWFNVDATNPNGQLDQYPFFTATQITAATPASLISYLRGQKALEDSANDVTETSATKLYRGRVHALGDIVNSAPVYVQKPAFDYQNDNYSAFQTSQASRAGVVYVGANDGMLHAISADDGSELWAFVPTAVMPYLYKLADKNYAGKHRYFVDGPVTISDAYVGGSWRTVLIGGLGKGGKSLFALDVTNPNSPGLLWEFSVTDSGGNCTNNFSAATTVCDADLGYTFGNAVTTRVNIAGDSTDTKWVALFASGYDNTAPGDQAARLYMVNLADASGKKEITTSAGTDPSTNGMAWINGWNDDGMHLNYVRQVYAGDLGGRVWRFDLKNETATLMTTLGSSGTPQPVTTRIELGDFGNDINQRVLYVGTGRYLTYNDVTNKDTQSIYAIRDTASSTTYPVDGTTYFRNAAARLVTSGSNRNSGFTYNNVTTNKYGWYMDFDAEGGERVIVHPRIFGANQANLTVVTDVPAANKCDVGGTGYIYNLDAQPSKSKTVVAADAVHTVIGAMAVGATMMTTPGGAQKVAITRSDGTLEVVGNEPVTYGSNVRRVSWRELRN